MSISQTIEDQVVAKLAPLLEPAGGPLRSIHVEVFGSPEELESIVARRAGILPAGFLSLPIAEHLDESFKPYGSTVQKIDYTNSYYFAAVSDTKKGTADKKAFAYSVIDLFNTAITDKDFATNPTNIELDPIRVLAGEPLDLQELFIYAVRFKLRVRGSCVEV